MKKWLVVIGILLSIVGCSSSKTAGIKIEGQTQTVLYGDERMGDKFSIDDISTVDTNGHPRAVVKLSNKTSVDQTIQYRFYWYDEQGLEVNTKQAPCAEPFYVVMKLLPSLRCLLIQMVKNSVCSCAELMINFHKLET